MYMQFIKRTITGQSLHKETPRNTCRRYPPRWDHSNKQPQDMYHGVLNTILSKWFLQFKLLGNKFCSCIEFSERTYRSSRHKWQQEVKQYGNSTWQLRTKGQRKENNWKKVMQSLKRRLMSDSFSRTFWWVSASVIHFTKNFIAQRQVSAFQILLYNPTSMVQ